MGSVPFTWLPFLPEQFILDPLNITKLIDIQKKTRNSAYADKPARRVYRSVKVIKHGTIRYAGYGFLSLYYSKFVPKMRRFSRTVSDFKNAVTLKSGSLKSLKVVPFDRLGVVSY